MSLRWRLGLVFGLVALCAWLSVGGFFPEEQRKATWWLPDEGVRLGLDLRGGIHIVISPDLEVAMAQELDAIRDNIASQLEDDGVTGRCACRRPMPRRRIGPPRCWRTGRPSASRGRDRSSC